MSRLIVGTLALFMISYNYVINQNFLIFRLLDLLVKHLTTLHLIVQRQDQKSLLRRDFLIL